MDINRHGDFIQTYSGAKFYILDPKPEDFVIDDIAHALAHKCRYSGHSKEFYSVAQHSILVANELRKKFPDQPELAWAGLLHDLGEAYTPDIPRPIKQMGLCDELVKCEHNIMLQAAKRFNFSWPEPIEVKQMDTAILADEGPVLMGSIEGWYLPEPPTGVEIIPVNPRAAEFLFIKAWGEFKPEGVI